MRTSLRSLACLLSLVTLLGAASVASAANFPLEITQPQPGLTTANRFYKAYPGLEYRVRMAVIGGLYPFQFSLGTAPAGMTIDPDDGTILWPEPTEAGSPHTVEATVVDSEGASRTVTWTITVTTSGFRFIDAVNGRTVADGGTGTEQNPWRTIEDWYEGNVYDSKYASSYVGEFLYWRAGVYSLSNVYRENVRPGEEPGRLPVNSINKPVVWLAYPGERPIIDHAWNGALDSGPFIMFYGTSENVYLDGFELRNMKCKAVEVGADGPSQVFRNIDFHDLAHAEDGKNCAFIMTSTGDLPSDYMVIQDSTFHGLNIVSGGAMIKIYAKHKLLIEDNTLHTVTGSGDTEGIALKGGTMTRVTVRGNVVSGVPRRSIGGNMHTLSDSEILYNCVTNTTDEALDINQDALATNLYYYRNTVIGRVLVQATDTAHGPFHLYNNIFVNEQSGTPEGSHVDVEQPSDLSRIILTDNLVGYPADGIADETGTLTAAYESYRGTHGCERAGFVPSPPDAGLDPGSGDGGEGCCSSRRSSMPPLGSIILAGIVLWLGRQRRRTARRAVAAR